jgi:hypothetical protein
MVPLSDLQLLFNAPPSHGVEKVVAAVVVVVDPAVVPIVVSEAPVVVSSGIWVVIAIGVVAMVVAEVVGVLLDIVEEPGLQGGARSSQMPFLV